MAKKFLCSELLNNEQFLWVQLLHSLDVLHQFGQQQTPLVSHHRLPGVVVVQILQTKGSIARLIADPAEDPCHLFGFPSPLVLLPNDDAHFQTASGEQNSSLGEERGLGAPVLARQKPGRQYLHSFQDGPRVGRNADGLTTRPLALVAEWF